MNYLLGNIYTENTERNKKRDHNCQYYGLYNHVDKIYMKLFFIECLLVSHRKI